jgi:hypothetical protein
LPAGFSGGYYFSGRSLAIAVEVGLGYGTHPKGRYTRMSALTEFFMLRGAQELAAKLKPETRTEMDHALRLGRQKMQAAEALWSNGSIAEALRLASQGLALVTDTLAGLDPERDFSFELIREMLAKGGVSKRRIDSVEKAMEQRRTFKLPSLDEEAPADSAEVFRRWVEAEERIHRTLEPTLMSRTQQVGLRTFRFVTAFLVLAVVAAVVVFFATRVPDDEIHASGFFGTSDMFAGIKAMDNNDNSWWLGPDGVSAWVEVKLGKARHVRQVRLLNSASPPWNDRGTKDYVLELYGNGRKLRSIPGTFPETTHPRIVTVPINMDGVERVRMVARTWYDKGAALAEIHVD